MLGSLATKLRILGFDTTYDKDSTDSELISRAKNQGRVLVTSDQELYLHAKQRHVEATLLRGSNDEARLLELFVKMNIRSLDLTKTPRCSVCNSVLEDAKTRDDLGRSIFKCENCGKRYWRGSHWRKLDMLFSNVNRNLIANQQAVSSKQIRRKSFLVN
jgi:uncharacterized protein with PIN domain